MQNRSHHLAQRKQQVESIKQLLSSWAVEVEHSFVSFFFIFDLRTRWGSNFDLCDFCSVLKMSCENNYRFMHYMKILELCEPIRGLGILSEKRCLDDEKLMLKSWLMVRKHAIGKTSIRKWWIKLREVSVSTFRERSWWIEGRRWWIRGNRWSRCSSKPLGCGRVSRVHAVNCLNLPASQLIGHPFWSPHA